MFVVGTFLAGCAAWVCSLHNSAAALLYPFESDVSGHIKRIFDVRDVEKQANVKGMLINSRKDKVIQEGNRIVLFKAQL